MPTPAVSARDGMVADIREFTVHDGPGLRTTVFLKGCPLRCSWCHNPETISPLPQVMTGAGGNREIGKIYSARELASILNAQASVLSCNQGGVTFSGGEPLMQEDFLADVVERIRPLHVLLDTSGFAPPEVFQRMAGLFNLVYFDVKLIDREAHRLYVGKDNAWILENLKWLAGSGFAAVVRVPLIPGVTDTAENLRQIAETLHGLPPILGVDLLPYNRAAGGKYAGLGMRFRPDFDESRPPNPDTRPFTALGIPVRVVGGQDKGPAPA